MTLNSSLFFFILEEREREIRDNLEDICCSHNECIQKNMAFARQMIEEVTLESESVEPSSLSMSAIKTTTQLSRSKSSSSKVNDSLTTTTTTTTKRAIIMSG